MFVPTDATGAGDPGEGAGTLSARRASPSGRRRDDGARRRRTGAPSRARCRGGVPPLSLQRPPRGPLLAGRRRAQHAGPLHVRAAEGPESGKGAAGKWTDAATGEHGDLLDVIRESCGLVDFRDVADEARRFLSLPRSGARAGPSARVASPAHRRDRRNRRGGCSPCRSRSRAHSRKRICAIAALRLCTEPEACASTRAAIIGRMACAPTETWPAMIAAVTDLAGTITGAHRTWLDPSGGDKAPIDTPRRAMGHLLGNAVRFGVARRCHGGRRRHRNHAVAAMRHARPCRWWRRSRPRISPPSCSRRRCAGSTSPATTIRPATARWRA